MTVSVIPETFHLVQYEAPVIAALAARLAADAGLGDVDLTIEVDETNPFGRVELVSLEPISLKVEGGGLEDPKRPRQFSEANAATTLGIALCKAADRLRPDFAGAPPDDALSNQQRIGWEVYSAGRLARRGWSIARPRLEYHFRIRFGFTDTVDAAFERLWTADELGWSDLEAALPLHS